jgi:hypothetical protein
MASADSAMSFSQTALDLADSKTEFEADYRLTSGVYVYAGHLTHAFHRERYEFGSADNPQVVILRRDLNEAVMLWPLRRWYMSSSFAMISSMLGDIGTEPLQGREAGLEMLYGEVATRYHVDRGAFIGDIWRSKDGIMLKALGTIAYNGTPTKGEFLLWNVRRVKADPARFVKPQGYMGLPLNFGQ